MPSPSSARLSLRPPLPSSALGDGGGGSFSALAARSMSSSPFGLRLEKSVKKTISGNLVVMLSETWCSYSMEVKSLFNRIGVESLVMELDSLDTVKLHRKGELTTLPSELNISSKSLQQP